jgi:tyrosine-specific transport protein
MDERKRRILRAISTLSGTIIGVGFFSLPYILSKVGIFTLTFYFLFLGSLVILVHLFFGELAILTPDLKRLPGFVNYHLGSIAGKVAFISAILGTYGTLLAYLIIGGNFLKNLFFPILKDFDLIFILLYFLIACLFIFLGINIISRIEFLDSALFLIILILILTFGYKFFNTKNLFLTPKLSDFFLPYGPILFSLWGASMIPEVEEILKENKKDLKKVIFISILISALFYFLFAISVCGILGKGTSENAISGLEKFLGKEISKILFLFGTITAFTSFVALGLTLQKIFWYDLKIEKNLSFALAVFPPLIFYFLGFNRFLPVISLVGGIFLGIDGILILSMYRKAKKSKIKDFLFYPFFLIFLFGIFYQIFYFLK